MPSWVKYPIYFEIWRIGATERSIDEIQKKEEEITLLFTSGLTEEESSNFYGNKIELIHAW